MAGRIPQEFIDNLLGRIDIVELIDQRVPLRKAGQNYTACCPFHDEKTASFTVSPSKQFYHCFGCGAHGSAIGFLIEYERLTFIDAVEELARKAGVDLPQQNTLPQQLQHQHADLFLLVKLADRFFRQQLRQHPARDKAVDYLRGRGIDGKTAQAFGIGYAPPGWDSLLQALTQAQNIKASDLVSAGLLIAKDKGGFYDRFRDRIIFPIRDRRGRTIAFGGRALSNAAPPKYLNSPETPIFHKSYELYGFYEAHQQQRKLQQLLVVEGYMDVVGLAQYDIHYAVATLGTATTAEHLEKLFRACPYLIFCYDGDQAGRNAAWRALENALPLLRDGRQAKFLFLPEGEDPDSLIQNIGRDAFEQRLQQALPLSDYFFQHLSSQTPDGTNSLDSRAQLVELARPLLQKLPAGAFLELMLQQLAIHTQIPVQRLNLSAALDSKQQPVAPKPNKLERGRANLAYQALQILLLRPELAQRVSSAEMLQMLSQSSAALLLEVIELWQQRPHIKAVAVIESYTGTEAGELLQQLYQRPLLISEDEYETVFLGALQELHKQAQKALLNRVTTGKLSPAELSPTERQLLRNIGRQQTLEQEENPMR